MSKIKEMVTMEFKQPVFADRIPKVGGGKARFGDILEEKMAPETIGKQLATEPDFEEAIVVKATRISFRKRIKRLRRKLGRVPKDEHPAVITHIDYMRSILAMHPKKFIKLIKVMALLKNLRQKPEFLIGAAQLHAIHKRYGRKSMENAKRHMKKSKKDFFSSGNGISTTIKK